MTPFPLTETASAELTTDRADATALPLAKRVRSGLGWIMSSSLIGELLRFIRSIVLARLLVPEDFGLFGMALTIVAALNALTTIGLDQTIVATRFDTRAELKAHLDTVWSAELIRGLIITLLVGVSAFPMARFYGQAHLRAIISDTWRNSFHSGISKTSAWSSCARRLASRGSSGTSWLRTSPESH